MIDTNIVYCGDCKDIIPEEIPPESIDLIYIDPPFFSGVNYEKIWKNGAEDKAYQKYWTEGINGFIRYMEGRLSLCKDILKPTGSIYLHCDWHANAHLRLLMDRIFHLDIKCEIIWDKGFRGTERYRNWQQSHDSILFYTKTENYIWNDQFQEYADSGMSRYNKIDEEGKHYALIKRRKSNGKIYYGKTYPKPKGKRSNDIISVPVLASTAKERLGYPTQKPEKLLERIILASSNKGDVVLDPMMGGGTTLAVAKKLNRQFIGMDVSPIACEKALTRLKMRQEEMIIIPNCVSHLEKMSDKVFQNWVVKRLGGHVSATMSSDKGIDGYTAFNMIPIQVKKSRDIGSPVIRQFATDAQIFGKKQGIFVALSFNDGAKKVIHEIYNKMDIEIELKTAEELIK